MANNRKRVKPPRGNGFFRWLKERARTFFPTGTIRRETLVQACSTIFVGICINGYMALMDAARSALS